MAAVAISHRQTWRPEEDVAITAAALAVEVVAVALAVAREADAPAVAHSEASKLASSVSYAARKGTLSSSASNGLMPHSQDLHRSQLLLRLPRMGWTQTGTWTLVQPIT